MERTGTQFRVRWVTKHGTCDHSTDCFLENECGVLRVMSSNYDTVVLATANLTNYYTLNSDGTDSKGSVNGVVTGGSFVTAGGCIDGSNCWTSTGVGVEQIVFASSQQPTSGDFAFEWGMKATEIGRASCRERV